MHTNTLYKAPKAKKNRDKSQSQKTSLQKHHTRSLTSKIPHNSAQCLGKKQGYKSRILTTSDRNVSFVNAKFQIVQVKVGKSVPEKLLTLPLPQDYHNTKPKKHNDDNDLGKDTSHGYKAPPLHTSVFLHPEVLASSESLLQTALKQPAGTTYMVRKKDLQQFYDTAAKLHLEQCDSHDNSKTLLLQDSQKNASKGDKNDKNNAIRNELSLYYEEQQIALQSAPKVQIQDLSEKENDKRREHYNSTNAKPLELFKYPHKHEIQAILCASKGNLYPIRDIIGKAYHDCLCSMNLLPKRFIQKTVLNDKDFAEITIDDVDISYNPSRYKFFSSKEVLDEFYIWLNSNFSSETLAHFRSSAFYSYNMSSQLQKGGSILHHAAQHGNADILKFVLSHGGDKLINQQTSNGSTPLHWASGAGWLDVVKLLVEDYGADYHLQTNTWSIDVFGRDSGQLPIHWAASSGHTKIVDYLYLLSPLTIGIKDEKDNSVVCVAKKGLHFDTIRHVKSRVDDEYVPCKLELHTIEHNTYVDHAQLHKSRQKKQQQQQQQHQHRNDDDFVDVDDLSLIDANKSDSPSQSESAFESTSESSFEYGPVFSTARS
jgi:hypothetical protein